jgi:hypothetical protein
MEITNQIFRKLAAFANGEPDEDLNGQIVDILDSDPIYLEILLDIQNMVEQHGEHWESALEDEVQLMLVEYEAKLEHEAFAFEMNDGEITALYRKSKDEIKQEMIIDLQKTYFSVGKQLAKLIATEQDNITGSSVTLVHFRDKVPTKTWFQPTPIVLSCLGVVWFPIQRLYSMLLSSNRLLTYFGVKKLSRSDHSEKTILAPEEKCTEEETVSVCIPQSLQTPHSQKFRSGIYFQNACQY